MIDYFKETWPEDCEGLSDPAIEAINQPNRSVITVDSNEHQRPSQGTTTAAQNRFQSKSREDTSGSSQPSLIPALVLRHRTANQP